VSPVEIVPLTRADVDDASRMLARSFDDSPLFRFLFPSERTRPRIVAKSFRATLLDALPFGQVAVARDTTGIIGLASWFAPDGYPLTTKRQAAVLARMTMLVPLAPTRVVDSWRYLSASDKVHPKNLHWYLGILGVDPPRQGEGHGAALIDRTLVRLDDEGLPAYLETDKESNLAWYARRRFELRKTLHPAPSGPPLWTMWRDPP
jgi:GNAT superfamily N-acetyltransferase